MGVSHSVDSFWCFLWPFAEATASSFFPFTVLISHKLLFIQELPGPKPFRGKRAAQVKVVFSYAELSFPDP